MPDELESVISPRIAHTRARDTAPYITKDGSRIRELMHPDLHGNRNQSLAEATVPPGKATALHIHRKSEELYHITRGRGSLTIADRTMAVGAGDTVHIPPGTPHSIRNIGPDPLVILCCCAPPYSHDDTALM